jgi:NADH dehydrogenase
VSHIFINKLKRNKYRNEFVQIADIAQAVVAVLKTTDSIGRIYELGGPKIYTMDELYDLVQYVLRINKLPTIELSNKTLMYSLSLSFTHI